MGYKMLNPANDTKSQSQTCQENEKPFYYLDKPDFFPLFPFLFLF